MDGMDGMKEFRRMILCDELNLDYNLIQEDVYNGSVNFFGWIQPNILIKFSQLEIRKVKGSFNCSDNNLISLNGCPEIVGGWFDCCDNELTSLKGCPEIVKGYFDCSFNNLTSLERSPKKITGNYWCDINKKKLIKPDNCEIRENFYG